METKLLISRISQGIVCSVLVMVMLSCDSLLDVEKPKSRITSDVVFADDVTATSAVTGIYHDMIDPGAFSSGSNVSVSCFAGLSSDEFVDFVRTDQAILDIEANKVSVDNSYISSLWTSMYKIIFEANSALEGIRASGTLTPSTRSQLEGEVLFVRAFCHFYLVNLFGDVPLVTTTTYVTNSQIQRTASSKVYEQIIEDLVSAKDLMSSDYPTSGRVRPNKFAASALLARVYLFQSDWKKAEEESTYVISQPIYNLVSDLNNVFKANSEEAIWQIMPVIPDVNTWEGTYFTVSFLGPLGPVMNEVLADAFDPNDARYVNWVGEYDTGNGVIHFPYKYKADLFAFGTTEYSMVLRLSEQYLIRAEARLMQSNLGGALADVDKIRERASLPKISDTNPGIGQDDLLNAIDQERRFELFTEWGHRWLDLKRREIAGDVLSPIKADWTSDDELYPIPALEFSRNPKLGLQNPGY